MECNYIATSVCMASFSVGYQSVKRQVVERPPVTGLLVIARKAVVHPGLHFSAPEAEATSVGNSY